MTKTEQNLRGAEILLSRLVRPKATPYEAGVDCAKNGPNATNCHFLHFATPEGTAEWERGKSEGKS